MTSTQWLRSPPHLGNMVGSTPAPVDWEKRHTELVRACEQVLDQWDRANRTPMGRDLKKALDKNR